MDIDDYPLPEWAVCRSTGVYMQAGAQLCTRNGQRIGNAFVHRIERRMWKYGDETKEVYVAVCFTDMGNELVLSLPEMEGLFYPPKYVMDPNEALRMRAVAPRRWMHQHLMLFTAAKSLLSDIEAMQHGLAGWYGPFETFTTNEWEDTAQVEWPNLTISADKLKKALEGKE